jgi:predicted Zn-dependent protease
VLVTEYDDTRAGEQASREIDAELGLVEDEPLQAYLDSVGKRLLDFAPERPFEYQFHVVDQREPNAFALPGGYIYVSRGALALANSEDELANVLGHEITHSAERHAAARQEITKRQSALLMPLLRFARLASYSRDQERSADRGGQRMAASAGYDPIGMASFLDQLRDIERMQFALSRMPNLLSTHPGTSERVTDCSVRAGSLSFERTPETTEVRRNDLAGIDGLLLGENPAEGVFEGSTFLHPDLGFRIRFPEDWALENGRSAVGARSPDGAAHIFLTVVPADPESGLDPEAAARLFLSRNANEYRGDLENARWIQLGPLPAYRVEGRGIVDGRNVGAQLTFVPLGGLMYRITTVAPIRVSREYMGRARVTARSFRALTPMERHSVAITQLEVVEAQAGESLGDLSRRTNNAWDDQRIAVLNGLSVSHVFDGGESVKIAVATPYLPAQTSAVGVDSSPTP